MAEHATAQNNVFSAAPTLAVKPVLPSDFRRAVLRTYSVVIL